MKTICNHLYCRDCIYKWLQQNKTCPVCQKNFEDENTGENNEEMTQENENMPPLASVSETEPIDATSDSDEDTDTDEELPSLIPYNEGLTLNILQGYNTNSDSD